MLHTLLTKITDGALLVLRLTPGAAAPALQRAGPPGPDDPGGAAGIHTEAQKQIENCLSEQLVLRTIRIYLLFLRVDLKPAPASCRRSGTACA